MKTLAVSVCVGCWVLMSFIAWNQTSEVRKYAQEVADLRAIIDDYESFNNRTAKVKVTFYAPELGGINTDSDPGRTAIMDTPVAGWTCAISRDLVEKGWLGRKIYIPGLGVRYASDIMGRSYKGKSIKNQIDICVGRDHILSEAKRIGCNTGITAAAL